MAYLQFLGKQLRVLVYAGKRSNTLLETLQSERFHVLYIINDIVFVYRPVINLSDPEFPLEEAVMIDGESGAALISTFVK